MTDLHILTITVPRCTLCNRQAPTPHTFLVGVRSFEVCAACYVERKDRRCADCQHSRPVNDTLSLCVVPTPAWVPCEPGDNLIVEKDALVCPCWEARP